MARMRFLIALLAAPATTVAAPNSWTPTGPEGGDAWSIEYATTTPGVALVTAGNGIYRTIDHGATWTFVRGLSVTNLVNFARDPGNPNRLTAVGPSAVPLRSDDGGQTFTSMARFVAPNGGYENAIAMAGNGVWYGGTSTGTMFRSADHGSTWEPHSTGLTEGSGRQVLRIVIDPRNSDHVHALTASTGQNLYSTINGGLSWSLHTNVCGTGCVDIARNPHAPDELVAASGAGLFASSDGGATWTQRDARVFSTVRYDPLVPGRVLAVVVPDSITRSVDGGQSWAFTTTLPITGISSVAMGLAFDPMVASRVLLGTQQGVFASDDSGTTWIERNAGINGAVIGRVLSIPPGLIARTFALDVTTGSGLHAYDTAGQRWSRVVGSALQTGVPAVQVRALGASNAAPDTLYAGGLGGLFRSIDGGQTWSKTTTSLDTTPIRDIAVSAANPQSLYVSTIPSVLYSGDGGSTFVPRSAGLSTTGTPSQLLVDPENQNRLYLSVLGAIPGIYRTSDGGVSWVPAAGGINLTEVLRIATDPEDFAILYAATAAGVMKSIDSGDTWTPFPGGHFFSDIAVDRHDGAHLLRSSYLITNGGVERSVDGGLTWQILPRFTFGIPRGVAFDYTTPASVMTIVDHGGVETLQIVPDVEITSSATGAAVFSPVDVQVTLRNRGPFAASRVVLTATVPRTGATAQTPRGQCVTSSTTGAVRCDIGHVHAGETLSITFDLPELQPGDDAVRFEALAREPDPDLENNRLTLAVERQSDLSLTATSSASSIASGETVRLTLTVGNGDFSPAEDVRVAVQLPPGLEWIGISPNPAQCLGPVLSPSAGSLTCSVGTLNRHSSAEIVITAIARAAGSAVVSASATSQGTDPLPGNNSASTTINVTTPPQVSGGGATGGGGGGGGSLSWAVVWALATLAALRRRARRQSLTS